ncbi:MAG: hypothetical protein AB1700_01560 [Bacillota bacterium]
MALHTYVLVGTAAAAAAGHALIPDHWLPYVLAAKARGMSRSRATIMAGIGALAHLFSTVLIGLVFTLAGSVVATDVSAGLDQFVGVAVIGLGLYFVWRGWPGWSGGSSPHDHEETGHGHTHACSHRTGSDYTLGAILGARPCAEAIPIFLAASTRGVFSSLAAIAAWAAVTVVSMVGIVWLSVRGLETLRFAWLERYGAVVSGAIIVAVGVIALL